MTAQNVGAGQRKRAVDSMKYGIGFSLVCGILICLTCQLVPEALIGIFSKDGAVITAGAQYIRTYSMDCVLVSFVFCMNAYFNGNGQSFICFAHSIAATGLLRFAVYRVAPFGGESQFECSEERGGKHNQHQAEENVKDSIRGKCVQGTGTEYQGYGKA